MKLPPLLVQSVDDDDNDVDGPATELTFRPVALVEAEETGLESPVEFGDTLLLSAAASFESSAHVSLTDAR